MEAEYSLYCDVTHRIIDKGIKPFIPSMKIGDYVEFISPDAVIDAIVWKINTNKPEQLIPHVRCVRDGS